MARNEEANLLVRIKETGKEALKGIGNGLDDIKVKAGVAAAALGAMIGKSVLDFAEADKAARKLDAAIKAQGLSVDEVGGKYRQYATALQDVTTFGDDVTLSALATGQALAGNVEFTQSSIEAVMNFATAMDMDLKSAFQAVGKTIGSNTNVLARYGVEIDATATEEEKLAQITEVLSGKFSGLARSQAEGLGALEQLNNTIGDTWEALGEQFAPMIETVARSLNEFFKTLQSNPLLLKFAAIILAVGAGVSALVAGLGTLIAIAPSIGAAFAIMTGPVGLISAAILALGAAVYGLYEAWDNNFYGIQNITFGVFNAIKSLWVSFADNFGSVFSNLGGIIKGAFTFDIDEIKSSYTKLKRDLATIGEDTAKGFDRGFKTGRAEKTTFSDLFNFDDKKITENAEKQAEKTVKSFQKVLDEEPVKYTFVPPDDYGPPRSAMGSPAAGDSKKSPEENAEELVRQWGVKEAVGIARALATDGIGGGVGEALGTFVDGFFPGLGTAIKELFSKLGLETDEFVAHLDEGFSNLGLNFFENLMKNMVTWSERIREELPNIVETLIDSILSNLPSFIIGMIQAAFSPEFHQNIISAIFEGFRKGLEGLWNNLMNLIGGGIEYYIKKLLDSPMFKQISELLKIGTGQGGKIGGFEIPALKFHSGGFVGSPIQKFASGGTVDDVPALLQAGEFVVNRDATKNNLGLLQNINAGGNSGGSGAATINIIVNGGLLGDEKTAMQFARSIDEKLMKLRRGNESIAFDKGIF